MLPEDMTDDDLQSLAEDAADLLSERHAADLFPSESIRLRLTTDTDRLRACLMLTDLVADTRKEFDAEIQGISDEQTIHLALDFLDCVLAEHLDSDREAMPRLDPAPYPFEGRTIYLSGRLRRPDLDAQADALLAADDPGEPEPA